MAIGKKTKYNKKDYNPIFYRKCEVCKSIINLEIKECGICLWGRKEGNRGKYKNRQKKEE